MTTDDKACLIESVAEILRDYGRVVRELAAERAETERLRSLFREQCPAPARKRKR